MFVCLSVTLVDQDHIGCKSWKLIARTISPTPSLFVAQKPFTYSQGNMGKFGEDWRWGGEKVACWSTKAAISLKRVKIEEKLLWRAYRRSPTLFRTVPPPTPYGLLFPKIGGSQPHPKTAITIISGTAKATDCKFNRYIHRVHPNTSPWKILEKRERGRIQGLSQFFWVPHIISGRGKATNFKLVRYIHRVHANKSPLKIWENRERGRIQGLPKFFEYPLLSQERIKLLTSNLADIFRWSMRTKAD